MFNSITETASAEYISKEYAPRSSPPWVWVGFLFAGAFFVLGVIMFALGVAEQTMTLYLTPIAVAGFIYWLFCVHRIHKILNEITSNSYPYTPGEAALRHIIPFYNLVWIFKWPSALSSYLKRQGRVNIISGGVIGAMLLLSLLLRFVDGAIGMALLFGVTMYVSAKVKKHVKALKGVTPDQLPPLPDPKVFSRPSENSTAPAPEVVEGR